MTLIQNLEEQITAYSIDISNPIMLAETVINIMLQRISELKVFILEKGFENQDAEILFFKELKPKVVSKLIYYNAIYKIETKKPHGGNRATKKYLNNELLKLKRYFYNNLEFYKYYRTGSRYLDNKYFVRGCFDIKLNLDTYYFESDRKFSTAYDYKVAKIIANDLIQVYIEDQLQQIRRNSNYYLPKETFPKLQWTASKSSLIELIYALYAVSAFDSGSSDIKSIARAFEMAFNIELGDFYHTYLELRNRKMNKTKFLDTLRDELMKRMDERD